MGANPARITNPRYSHITANVFDENGNPIAGIPVVFSVSAIPLEETLESGGTQVFTDSNGQAFDILYTRRSQFDTQKDVTVTATAANGVSGSVTVGVN